MAEIHDDENDCYISSTVYASKRCHGSRFIFGSQCCTALIFNIITSRTLIPHHGTMTFILVVGLSLCTIIYYAQSFIMHNWFYDSLTYFHITMYFSIPLLIPIWYLFQSICYFVDMNQLNYMNVDFIRYESMRYP